MHYQTFHILCQKIKQNSSLSAVCASPVTAAFTQLSGLLRTARCNPLSLELSHTRPPFTHHVFDATVLALRVLPDGDQVDIGVRSLVALDGDAGPHVCVQVKGLPEQQVHGGVTCSDGCLQGSWWRKKKCKKQKTLTSRNLPGNLSKGNGHVQTFQTDLAPVHGLFGVRRDHPSAARSLYRRHVPLLPRDWSLQRKILFRNWSKTNQCLPPDPLRIASSALYLFISSTLSSHNFIRKGDITWNFQGWKHTKDLSKCSNAGVSKSRPRDLDFDTEEQKSAWIPWRFALYSDHLLEKT